MLSCQLKRAIGSNTFLMLLLTHLYKTVTDNVDPKIAEIS